MKVCYKSSFFLLYHCFSLCSSNFPSATLLFLTFFQSPQLVSIDSSVKFYATINLVDSSLILAIDTFVSNIPEVVSLELGEQTL